MVINSEFWIVDHVKDRKTITARRIGARILWAPDHIEDCSLGVFVLKKWMKVRPIVTLLLNPFGGKWTHGFFELLFVVSWCNSFASSNFAEIGPRLARFLFQSGCALS